MTISVITPTCDRPSGMALAERWMRRQTRQPDEWIVADGGREPAVCQMGQSHVHQPRPAGAENFLGNLEHGIARATGDVIVWFEDDDHYQPTHLETLERQLLDAPDALAAGDDDQRYYNIQHRVWRVWQNLGACLCQTALRREALPTLMAAIRACRQKSSYGVDAHFWRSIPVEQRALAKTHTVLGIKGLPGRVGLGVGHRPDDRWTADPDFAQLRRWIGAEADVYIALAQETVCAA